MQATLINRGFRDLIAPHRILFDDAPNTVRMLGKPTSRAEYQPWSLIQMVELIFFLPLNLIPYVGVPAFLLITGRRLGLLAHHRWYKLRGLTRKEIKVELKTRSWEYLFFGLVCMILELVPILSFLFLLTSSTGSALWVADMEQRRRARVGQRMTAEEHAAIVRAASAEETLYRDDPV